MDSFTVDSDISLSMPIEKLVREKQSLNEGSSSRKGQKGNKHVFDIGGAIRMNTDESLKNATKRRHKLKKKGKGELLMPSYSDFSIVGLSRVSVDNYSIGGRLSSSKLSSSIIYKDVALPILNEIIIAATESTNNSSAVLDIPSWIHSTSSKYSDYIGIQGLNRGDIAEKRPSNIVSQGLHTVITHLGLPIFVAKPQPFIGKKIVLERILLDTQEHLNCTALGITEREISNDKQTVKIANSNSETVEDSIVSPFEMIWCFGFNPGVPVLNVSSYNRTAIFFTNSQFVVFYNIQEERMLFLHGHQNNVTCIGIDSLGTILASGDKGPKCRVVIWDTSPKVMKILENEYLQGIELLAISCDGEYLITVSSLPEQQIQLWDWKTVISNPVSLKMSNINLGIAKKLVVHPKCRDEFVIVYENGIEFIVYEHDKHHLTKDAFQSDVHQSSSTLGGFTDTVLLENQESLALSSTSKGYVIVWIENGFKHMKQRKGIKKQIRIHMEAITHIVTVDNLIATATVTGKISFYDLELSVLYWTYKLPLDQLMTFSFNLTAPIIHKEQCSSGEVYLSRKLQPKGLVDATLYNRPLYVRPFIVTSIKGKMVYLDLNNAESRVLLFCPDAFYTAIDIHPKNDYLCAGTSQGQCLLFDFLSRKIKVSRQIYLPDNVCQAVSFIKYSPMGNHLACGMYTGTLWLLDPLILTPKHGSPLNDCSKCITKIVFSEDDTFLAVTDQSYSLTVYKLTNEAIVVGEYLVHSKYITDIMFSFGSGVIRKLYTIAEDRTMVEFSIADDKDTLKFVTVHRVEQTAIPKRLIDHPTQDQDYLMVNSEMKFKLLRKSDLKCCKTVQAPNFGHHITYLQETQGYLLFGTAYHIGLHILPLDGNPYKTLAYLASSSPIVCIRVHSSGKYLFTISENSTAINMWKINTYPVDRFFSSGGEGLDAYLSVLEGGRNGFQEKELRDFFLVGQFLHQGETPGVIRRLSNTINVCETASIFQALGFFPTILQLDNMIYELTGSYDPPNKKTIDFEQFVQLFINHRPNIQLSINDIRQAFRDFYGGLYFTSADYKSSRVNTDPIFDSPSFVEQLSETGDKIPYDDLANALSILCEDSHVALFQNQDQSLPFMPMELDFKKFLTNVLGFNETGA